MNVKLEGFQRYDCVYNLLHSVIILLINLSPLNMSFQNAKSFSIVVLREQSHLIHRAPLFNKLFIITSILTKMLSHTIPTCNIRLYTFTHGNINEKQFVYPRTAGSLVSWILLANINRTKRSSVLRHKINDVSDPTSSRYDETGLNLLVCLPDSFNLLL